jgi:hypothetical protein
MSMWRKTTIVVLAVGICLAAGVTKGAFVPIKVNFQSNSQGDQLVPAGYLPDYGLPYGDRSNGFSYGWSRDITADARDRNSANSRGDQRYDTLIHFQKGADAIWEIAIPNGKYDVLILSGDPDNTDQTNTLDVENVIVVDPNGQSGNWDKFNVVVTVADGRLTVKPAPGSSNAKIAFLEISEWTGKAKNPDPANGAVGVATPLFQWTKGDTAVFHNVYVGTTPDLTEANLVGKNQPFTLYYHVAGLEPGATYYWRVDEIEADMTTVRTGDVWTFVAQDVKAYYPTPADESSNASPTGALTWQAGLAALKHHLYFGISVDDVTDGTADTDKGELTDPTYAPTDLDSLTTYYWRVDELGPGGAVKAGAVWSFTTYLPVDDFESYTDLPDEEIFSTWIDGFTDGTNGSTVGYFMATNGTFGETTIVHSGLQSMPMDYNNVNSPFYSEACREFAPVQDWTADELSDLRLDFRGAGANGAGALYVAVEDSAGKVAVVTNSDPAAVKAMAWTEWKIPLSSLTGVNPAKVKRLYIGVGDRNSPAQGGAGRIYIDDIRVTRP